MKRLTLKRPSGSIYQIWSARATRECSAERARAPASRKKKEACSAGDARVLSGAREVPPA
jgi:hypothetical protein